MKLLGTIVIRIMLFQKEKNSSFQKAENIDDVLLQVGNYWLVAKMDLNNGYLWKIWRWKMMVYCYEMNVIIILYSTTLTNTIFVTINDGGDDCINRIQRLRRTTILNGVMFYPVSSTRIATLRGGFNLSLSILCVM